MKTVLIAFGKKIEDINIRVFRWNYCLINNGTKLKISRNECKESS